MASRGKKEVLYNGIELPAEWPPNYGHWERNPMPVPYLDNPPEVIPIDVGRQLFVDSFLVAQTGMQRVYHRATYYPENPVLVPDQPWELGRQRPSTMPFSDGVWWDPAERVIKMWYSSTGGTYLARSEDGLHWQKLPLDVEPGTNMVLRAPRDSVMIWPDENDPDPQRRYKMSRFMHEKGRMALQTSADGIHWGDVIGWSGIVGDRVTYFFNPFRKVWVCSAKVNEWMGDHWFRMRAYKESPQWEEAFRWEKHHNDIAKGEWAPGEPVVWVGADRLDPPHPWEEYAQNERQLYNLDATPYESLMLGLFSIWQGPENDECARRELQKQNQVFLGFSRDGFHWDRPDRRAFLPTDINNVDAWNRGNVQSVGGGCLVMGDKLYFYCSGRAYGKPGAMNTTGLGILRRDGFASLEAGVGGGMVTTRPVTFQGEYLFVNVDADGGELRAEVLDKDGRVIPGYSQDRCKPIAVDKTLQQVTWEGIEDLRSVAGQPVRLRFHLRNGGLYAFWVSPDKTGASHGYVAGGGPGFTGPIDTVGGK